MGIGKGGLKMTLVSSIFTGVVRALDTDMIIVESGKQSMRIESFSKYNRGLSKFNGKKVRVEIEEV